MEGNIIYQKGRKTPAFRPGDIRLESAIHDRDTNAAQNILKEGLRLFAQPAA